MATYVIGDVQGCAATLDRLLTRLPLRARDRLWFAGDLVNRGPRSLDVLRTVHALGDRATVVLGNHDLHLLGRAIGVAPEKRRETLADVLAAPDCGALCAWLRTRNLLHREGSFVLVHAGIPPRWSADEAAAFAADAERALAGPEGDAVVAAYAQRSGRAPETLAGARRHAAVCVALTTLRTLAPDGTPDAEFKGSPEEAPPGRTPWFRAPTRRTSDVTVVFGHWAALGLRIEPGIVATDSGCVWGKELSAVRIDDLAVFQEPSAD